MSSERPVGEPVTGPPARAPGRDVRRGRSVTLVPVDPAIDAGPLWRATQGSEGAESVWTYLAYGPFADVEAMRAWMETLVPSQDPLFLTVHTAAGPSGVVSFMNVDREMRHLELGHIWYVPAAQRTGANTESVFLMLREAFEELGHRRVEWKCDALNARSRTAAERLGFTFEGVFRQHMIVKGRNRDTAWYSMLDTEWPHAKAAFERWLGLPTDDRPPLASLR
jgi:RimJ/RimL family protein N-acetyltransferase